MRLDRTPRRPIARFACAALAVIAVCAGVPAVPSATHATPGGPTDPAHGRVVVDTGPPSIPSDGSFTINTTVRVDEPTPYLEIRLQIHRPSGQLLFQRTEVRSDVETGTVTAEFARELEDLSLSPDAYPYEIRVRTEVGEPFEQIVEGHLLIHAPNPETTPLAIVLRVADTPGFDPAGNFVVDPATSTPTLEQIALIAGAVIDDPRLRLTLGIPGMTLDAWSRAASGYTLATPAGLREVDAAEELPRRHAETLRLLAEAARTGRLELLTIPYADPDIGALAESRALLDLGVHYAHARSAYLDSLETSPSAGTAVVGDGLPPGTLDTLKEHDIAWVLLDGDSLTAQDERPAPGPWGLRGTKVLALVVEDDITAALPSEDASEVLSLLFERSISEEATVPVVAPIEIGPGHEGAAERVIALMTLIERTPWTAPITATEAVMTGHLGIANPVADIVAMSAAPKGYAEEVTEARRYATALESALGVADEDARAVTEASLLAQSARWAGPDGRWSQADRGRAFASAAVREAADILEQVTLTVKDVTLPGPSGELPLSISNGSTKDLTVKLVLTSREVHLPLGDRQSFTLRPQENLHTVRVDLGTTLSGRIGIELRAGDVLLDTATVTVRASYLDRLAVIGGVALLLMGLLLYIRRRVRSADAGSMP